MTPDPVQQLIAEPTDAERATLRKLMEKGPLVDLSLRDGERVISGPRRDSGDLIKKIKAALKEGAP